MEEQELITRCRQHAIPYSALSADMRRELNTLLSLADTHGAAFLIDAFERHAEECDVNPSACDSLLRALAELLSQLSEEITELLSGLGNTRHTVSFSLSNTRISADMRKKLSQWQEGLNKKDQTLRLLTREFYRESATMLQSEQLCMTCRLTNQLICYAVALSEMRDERLQGMLSARESAWQECEARRTVARTRLEEGLQLCEQTVPTLLTEFRGQIGDTSRLSLTDLIRACESLQGRVASLHSWIISKI